MTNAMLTGTYSPTDCTFLITELSQRSPMPCWEEPPAPEFFELFECAMTDHAETVAAHVAVLAHTLSAGSRQKIVLGSLVRAGTPYGVLLARALRLLGHETTHYGISLIKQYGVDFAALDYVLAHHEDFTFWFVDGWTGKGGISRVLAESVARFNHDRGVSLPTQLAVLSDLAGVSAHAATTRDYLAPSAMLDAPMNGLLSKTFGEDKDLGANSFHGAFVYRHLAAVDRSNDFVDRVGALLADALETGRGRRPAEMRHKTGARAATVIALRQMMNALGIDDDDKIKHGYCETVRAVQRRPMSYLLVRDMNNPVNLGLRALADALKIPVVPVQDLQYGCVGICK